MDNWITVVSQKPTENEIVDTKIDDNDGIRNEQTLKLNGKLWWLPDGKMYVYYTPTHWKSIHTKEETDNWDQSMDN